MCQDDIMIKKRVVVCKVNNSKEYNLIKSKVIIDK